MSIYYSDIDECSSVPGPCSDVCVNTNGSFNCSCPSGMELNSDMLTCTGKCSMLCASPLLQVTFCFSFTVCHHSSCDIRHYPTDYFHTNSIWDCILEKNEIIEEETNVNHSWYVSLKQIIQSNYQPVPL